MPIVPSFGDDEGSKVSWLRRNFRSRDEFFATVDTWNAKAQRFDIAMTMTHMFSLSIITALSLAHTVLSASGNRGESTDILGYTKAALGICGLFAAQVCKQTKENYATAISNARTQIPTSFFQANGIAGATRSPDVIWGDEATVRTAVGPSDIPSLSIV